MAMALCRGFSETLLIFLVNNKSWPPKHHSLFPLTRLVFQEMLVAVSVLCIALSWFLYHHPPSTWPFPFIVVDVPRSLPPAPSKEEPRAMDDGGKDGLEAQPKPNSSATPESSPSPQTTPKALPRGASAAAPIPSFSLESNSSSDDDDDDDDLPPPSFPAMHSAQRASGIQKFMAPPTVVPKKQSAPSQMMMPPPRIVPSNLRPLPVPSRSMHVPSTGPLPNRGPPTSSGLAPQPQAGLAVKTPNARNKVLLSPGHSPLDWANLQKSGNNLSGVSSLIRVTPSQLKYNNGRKARPAWSSYHGKVYNITPYLPFHPGGEGELRRAAGKDGAKLFMEVHPWVNWENMLGECVVGIMVAETDVQAPKSTSLEDLD